MGAQVRLGALWDSGDRVAAVRRVPPASGPPLRGPHCLDELPGELVAVARAVHETNTSGQGLDRRSAPQGGEWGAALAAHLPGGPAGTQSGEFPLRGGLSILLEKGAALEHSFRAALSSRGCWSWSY